jgi:hypothetical protein
MGNTFLTRVFKTQAIGWVLNNFRYQNLINWVYSSHIGLFGFDVGKKQKKNRDEK